MKKLIQISILLVIVFALILGMVQAVGGKVMANGGNTCRVGWNNRTGTCLTSAIGYKGPIIMPYVGWNS